MDDTNTSSEPLTERVDPTTCRSEQSQGRQPVRVQHSLQQHTSRSGGNRPPLECQAEAKETLRKEAVQNLREQG